MTFAFANSIGQLTLVPPDLVVDQDACGFVDNLIFFQGAPLNIGLNIDYWVTDYYIHLVESGVPANDIADMCCGYHDDWQLVLCKLKCDLFHWKLHRQMGLLDQDS